MPDLLNELLKELDTSNKATCENTIASEINSVTKDSNSLEEKAEIMAFSFYENHDNQDLNRGTYFGPKTVWVSDDGDFSENPSLSSVDHNILHYWSERSKKTNNNLMKARYSGLVWDFSKKVTGKQADVQLAIDCVNSLIAICDDNLCEHHIHAVQKITRAYKVSCSLKNKDLIKASIKAMISLENRIGEDNKPGLWGFTFDLLILGKEKNITSSEIKTIIGNMESRLERVSTDNSPYNCESAGIPLANYYRKKNKLNDVSRVINKVCSSFELSSINGNPIQASLFLQHAHNICLNFHQTEKAENISKKILEVGSRVVSSMNSFSHSIDVPEEKLEAYLNDMIKGGLETSLCRISAQFIPKKDSVENQVTKLANKCPLSYLFEKKLHSHNGRPVATIGSIEDDLNGHIIDQLSQNMTIDSFFLRNSFIKLYKTYNPSSSDLSDYIMSSPVFDDTKRKIISRGIDAFIANDYITSIHLLVPQVEAAIRTLVELSGGVTLKKNKSGGLQLLTFDDLLRDDAVSKCFNNDTVFYFRGLLTDQRGWNVRNDVCHGVSPITSFDYWVADRVFHVLLCLAQVKEK